MLYYSLTDHHGETISSKLNYTNGICTYIRTAFDDMCVRLAPEVPLSGAEIPMLNKKEHVTQVCKELFVNPDIIFDQKKVLGVILAKPP